MAYLEELLPEFRKGAKIRCNNWKPNMYICMKDDTLYYGHGFVNFDYDILSDKWELYQEEPIDWDYIIKNKCPCWFWNDGEEDKKELSLLCGVPKAYGEIVYFDNGHPFHNCRPARKDELTFYEDRKK